ncbi:hypothetical protein KRR40_42725 [Niabella defluvii]|nr:hypothetical protein KRR40_42725 [Niabella sp. I65]
MEMFIHQWWEIANLRVRQMDIAGDSAKLLFKQPESRIQSEHPGRRPGYPAKPVIPLSTFPMPLNF